ncbi:hypothetical protein RRSWK_01074 [Rhodopirellula sp. SWK7]|nr:hypothetical protein RRSWK_01074 [Rhodopirellula sp. SWK7]
MSNNVDSQTRLMLRLDNIRGSRDSPCTDGVLTRRASKSLRGKHLSSSDPKR